KPTTERRAVAESIVHVPASLGKLLLNGSLVSKKGPVFHTAIIAGTMAAKNTAQLIPLCHPLAITSVKIKIHMLSDQHIEIRCEAKALGPTGVEMEALSGASVAALTIYDMLKAHSTKIEIKSTRLLEKSGGKNDFKR
ncbi:MAG TPA: cyclic pyranopterin monophosphate synthase MoaC, partial [Myxococcota bacterium]|nr:cyclic pyranopterin monophosphate synthase MoaC [Myxococcota bacterium]